MKEKLVKLLENSHSPYSKVKVSAIVVAGNKQFSGVNVENAAFPSSLCAERHAIGNAITHGVKAGEINEIHIHSNLKKVLYPCGACLQVMSETLASDAKVFLHGPKTVEETTMKELMPNSVEKESFGWK